MDLTDKNSFHPPLWDCQAEEEGRIFSQHQESPGQPGARKTSQSSKLDLINLAAFNETLIYSYTGCPKKNAWSCFLAITPLWNGLGRKVGGVSKNSGNSPCDRHKNFPNWPFRSWENWVQSWQPYLKNLDKNEGIFFWIQQIFFANFGSNFLTFYFSLHCFSRASTWYSKCEFYCPPQI